MVLSDSSLSEIARGIFQAKQPCKPTDDDNVTMGPVGFFLRGPWRVIFESKFQTISLWDP